MKKYLFAITACCLASHAFTQIAVRNEPRHHNVFENEYVRVLDVWLAPKDTTQFHIHATPSVFNMFTKTVTGSQLMGGQPSKNSASVAGTVSYDSLATPRIHRVWNEDTTWYHVMDVELLGGKPHSNDPVLQNVGIQLLFDEPLVRGYHLQLPASAIFQLPSSENGYLLLGLGADSVTYESKCAMEHRVLKAGHYRWVDGGLELLITNGDGGPADFTILQLR